MIKNRMSLPERAAAGLVSRYAAERHNWYLIILAAKIIHDSNPYQAASQTPGTPAPARPSGQARAGPSSSRAAGAPGLS
jgi:hypothetical protein